MRYTCTSLSLLCLLSSVVLAATSPPATDDPLIVQVNPVEAQSGQQVQIRGVNFGSAPLVTFNGTSAPIVGQRSDLMVLVTVVPAGASSGDLVVTNTDSAVSSNPAAFTVVPGTFTPACTLQGTVTSPGLVPVANTAVVAQEPGTSRFLGMDLSDATGNYSIGASSAGQHVIWFFPPTGTSLVRSRAVANCPGTLDQALEVGSRLSGTVRRNQIPFDPVPNAMLYVFDSSFAVFFTVTDAEGDFIVQVPDNTYGLFTLGPIGGRLIAQLRQGIAVSGDTVEADIMLDIGWLLSGTVRYQRAGGEGPLGGADVELFDNQGSYAGNTFAITDGNFWLAGSAGLDHTLNVSGSGLLRLEVQSIALTSDTELDRALTVYSAEPHGPTMPLIKEPEFLVLQEGRRTAFGSVNVHGASVSVRFPDGVGGWVDGEETHVDPVRGLIVTRTPALAVSGNAHVRVDGVDGPGYPLTIEPGVYDPGSYTISGTMTDGSAPVEGVLVVLVRADCDQEDFTDFDLTNASGSYTVNHATGDYWLYIVPPVPSGLSVAAIALPNLTGDTIADVVLTSGASLMGRIVDSGVGPVGAASTPITNSLIWAESQDVPIEDWLLSDSSGGFAMNLIGGQYDCGVDPPFQSRYLETYLEDVSPSDLGEIALDSGFFVEGYVVDETGFGVPGVEVVAQVPQTFESVSFANTVDAGRFRMAVPAGTYRLEFRAHDDLDHILRHLSEVEKWTDTLLYPVIVTEPAGHIQGTAYLAEGVTPVPGVRVIASDFASGAWVDAATSCQDGTYDIRVGPGTYRVVALPDDPCLSLEIYDERDDHCEADPVAVAPAALTTGIDFTLAPGGGISGRVTDDWGVGVTDAGVCVDNGSGPGACPMVCDSVGQDGWYNLRNLPVGTELRVHVNSASYGFECWDDRIDCIDYDPVSVVECQDTPGIDFNLSDTPGPVPDGANVPGVPLTANYFRGSTVSNLTVYWEPTCNADGHALYFGNLGSFGNYTRAFCHVGAVAATVLAPPGDVFFLVVGTNGETEGSYGLNSEGTERPSAGGAFCGHVQDLSHHCMP